MPNPQPPYEVEIRYKFDNYEEACNKIPFLNDRLKDKKTWDSRIYGRALFESGQLLRIGVLYTGDKPVYFLCLKGPDIGSFANIRQEIEEIISDGITGSDILKRLGGKENSGSLDEVIKELNRLGHYEFMSFQGEDAYGYYEPLNVDIKLMSCPALKYPLMVELEKSAASVEEAKKREKELFDLSRDLDIDDLRVREEPPTLLYQAVYGHE